MQLTPKTSRRLAHLGSPAKQVLANLCGVPALLLMLRPLDRPTANVLAHVKNAVGILIMGLRDADLSGDNLLTELAMARVNSIAPLLISSIECGRYAPTGLTAEPHVGAMAELVNAIMYSDCASIS